MNETEPWAAFAVLVMWLIVKMYCATNPGSYSGSVGPKAACSCLVRSGVPVFGLAYCSGEVDRVLFVFRPDIARINCGRQLHFIFCRCWVNDLTCHSPATEPQVNWISGLTGRGVLFS